MSKDTTTPTWKREKYVPQPDDLQHFYRASRTILTPEATHLYSHLFMLATQGEPTIITPIEQLVAYIGFARRRLETALEQLHQCSVVMESRFMGEYEIELLPRSEWDFRGAEKAKSGHVYLINYGSVYKLGGTRDLNTRLKQHTRGHPQQPELITSIRTDDAFRSEKFWKQQFSDLRAHRKREWFNLGEREIAWLKTYSAMKWSCPKFNVQIRWEMLAYDIYFRPNIQPWPAVAQKLSEDDTHVILGYIARRLWGDKDCFMPVPFANLADDPHVLSIMHWLHI